MRKSNLHLKGRLRSAVSALAILPFLTGVAGAQSVVSTDESFLEAGLATGGAHTDGAREMGLVLDIKPGWKTYWRNPGDAGIPPRFDWSGSVNVEAVEIAWPRPETFESFGMTTLGYADRVVLPLTITPADPNQPIALSGELMIGVCDAICVIEQTSVAVDVMPEEQGQDAFLISDWRRQVPSGGEEIGLIQASCRLTGGGADRSFEAVLKIDHPLPSPMVILEGPAESWFHDTQTEQRGGEIAVASTLSLVDEGAWVGRKDIRITVLAGDYAAEIEGCSAPSS